MHGQVISYPKSGRSWLRFMLAEARIEGVNFHHDGFEFNNGDLPPHNFSVESRLAKYSVNDKIILLRRDPRDVMVSLYHQVTGRFKDFFDFQGSISDFIRHNYFGAHVLSHYMDMWDEISAQRNYIQISYEAMHEDTAKELLRVLKYLDLPAEEQAIQALVEAGNIENMKRIENAGTFSEPWLRPRNGFNKVRRGKVGNFKEELVQSDIQYLNEVFSLE